MKKESEGQPEIMREEDAERRSIEKILEPFWGAVEAGELEAESLGRFINRSEEYEIHRFILRGERDTNSMVRLGIFATIHGDEPLGAPALIELTRMLQQDAELFRGYELYLYPLCNPTGYQDGTRHSRNGKDLNRYFWRKSSEPEVQLLEQEISRCKYHGIVALHADDTSDGIYGFVRGATISRELLIPALHEASAALAVNPSLVIDGFRASGGVISEGYDGILSAGSIEPRPFEIVFETPALASEDLQVRAMVLALRAILQRYRAMLSVANDI